VDTTGTKKKKEKNGAARGGLDANRETVHGRKADKGEPSGKKDNRVVGPVVVRAVVKRKSKTL